MNGWVGRPAQLTRQIPSRLLLLSSGGGQLRPPACGHRTFETHVLRPLLLTFFLWLTGPVLSLGSAPSSSSFSFH